MTGRPPATATIAVRVDTSPPLAFELFTREIDRWWRRGHKFRHSGGTIGRMHLEPRLGGAVTETWTEHGKTRHVALGHVTAWQPPTLLQFTWRNATFAPFECTEVEVTFVPTGEATLVTVRHRGWEELRQDHPARHGMDDAAMQRAVGLWWGELLIALREVVAPAG